MSIANGLALPISLSNGTTADAVQVMNDFNYILNVINRALLDSGGSAGMNAQSTQIHNLANGTAANDAVNLSQLQTYLPLSGGTLTGALVGTSLSLSSTLSVSGASTLAALTASGLITGNAGFTGTTLSLSSTLSVTGLSTVAGLNASGLITGNAGFTGTTLSLSGAASLASTLSVAGLTTFRSGANAYNTVVIGGAGSSGYFASYNSSGTLIGYQGYWSGASYFAGFTVGATPIVFGVNNGVSTTINVDGTVTFSYGVSGTTLNLSSTLNVSGASTLAALTASGLITGNAGFSGTTLSLSSTLSVSGTSTVAALTASGRISRDANAYLDVIGTTATLNMGNGDSINVDRTLHKFIFYSNNVAVSTLDTSGNFVTNGSLSGTTLSLSSTLMATGLITGNGGFTGNVVSNNNTNGLGYLGLPQNSQSAAYTIALADIGKHVLITGSSATGITVPLNSTTAFPIGAAITIVNDSTVSQTITPAGGVTIKWAGNGSTGARTLATIGEATLLKTGTDTWYISGVGLS